MRNRSSNVLCSLIACGGNNSFMRSFRKLAKYVMALVLIFSAIQLFLSVKPASAYTDGTPYVTTNITGITSTFNAVNFNSGSNYDAYWAYAEDLVPSGYQDTTYRTDNPTNVDIYKELISGVTHRYVVSDSSGPPYNYGRGYLKYTVNVSGISTGWFDVSFRARMGASTETGNLSLVVDGILKGDSNGIIGNSFATVSFSGMPVYLGNGTHVITIQYNKDTYLDTITFTQRSVAPSFPTPTLVTDSLTSGDVFVADVSVNTGSGCSYPCADTTGTNDATQAIQDALNTAGQIGGGTVYLPSGTFKLLGGLNIPTNVTLHGNWKNPISGTDQAGTILAPYSTTVSAVTSSGLDSVIRYLSIWYPSQGSYAGGTFTPTVYPYTINAPNGIKATNLTLYNSYKGINNASASTTDISNIYGTVFNKGITADGNYEYSNITSIYFDPGIWMNAPSAISNKPTSAQVTEINTYTQANLSGVTLLRNDGLELYGITINDAYKGVLFQASSQGSSYGVISRISTPVQMDSVAYPGVIQTDNVLQASGFQYSFAADKLPASTTNFTNVKTYSTPAKGDGVTDDTSAIQAALTYRGSNGGGIVYLPPGAYRVTSPISIPTGVELRGGYDYTHSHESLDATIMVADFAGDTDATSDTDNALLTLNTNSGIRGFTVWYKRQGFANSSDPTIGSIYPVVAYPYTVRSAGTGTWVEYMEMPNSYKGIDLYTNNSNNFLLKGLWMNAASRAIRTGNATSGGVIEKVDITFGTLLETARPNSPRSFRDNAQSYTTNNEIGFVVGNTTSITAYGLNSYGLARLLHTINEVGGSGPSNLTLYQPSCDLANGPDIYIDGGSGNINLIGLQASNTTNSNYAQTTANFTGALSIYDTLLWPSASIIKSVNAAGSGTVSVYGEGGNNLALNKTATMTGTPYTGHGPDQAVDGNTSTYTQDSINELWAFMVDLGSSTTIGQVVVTQGTSNYATAFTIIASNDGVNWTTVATQSAGTGGAATYNFAPFTARWVKMVPTAATGSYAWGLDEFAVYANTNLALNKTATMTGTPYTGHGPDQAVDGNTSTYTQDSINEFWAFMVDLGSSTTIGQVVVTQSTSNYATAFTIIASNDGVNWTTVATQSAGTGGAATYNFAPITARWVKMVPTAAMGSYAWGLYEFSVYN